MNQQKMCGFWRELRKEKGISQEELAEKLNVAGRTVSRWETGKNMPDISMLIELAAYFGVTIQELIDGERKSENMNEEKEILQRVAEYEEKKDNIFRRELLVLSFISLGLYISTMLFPIFEATVKLPESMLFFCKEVESYAMITSQVVMIFVILKLTGLWDKTGFIDKFGKGCKILLGIMIVIRIALEIIKRMMI